MSRGETMKNFLIIVSGLFLFFTISGCAPLILGGGAAAGYKMGSDERTPGTLLDDSTLVAKINVQFFNDPVIRARQIDVDSVQGNVILSGMVETEYEAERAVEIANSVVGVKKVDNNLQIGSRTFMELMTDKQLGIKVKTKLVQEPSVRSLNIDVDVYRGVVTLTGLVESAGTKDTIIELARTTPGAVKIVDNISVQK